MANYVFEVMAASDAAAYTSTDRLFFESAGVAGIGVTHAAATTGPLSSTAESITLTEGTKALTFSAAQLSYASTHGGVIFINGDELTLATDAGGSLHPLDAGHGHASMSYGFGGDDFIDLTANGSAANDTVNGGGGDDTIYGSSSYTDASGNFTEADYLMGGNGGDYIVGGDGNDHIYGNTNTATAGAADGSDGLYGENGNDYIQGNAGNDYIDGGDGNDRLYGGSGDDSISGGNGNDYLQGNKGNDELRGGDGNDTMHGGANDDSLYGANGSDQLFGDAGDDTLQGGNGYDTLTGGDGNDIFAFYSGEATNTNVSVTTGASAGLTDVITDYTSGSDSIRIGGFSAVHVYHQQTGVTFTSVAAAQVYAEQLMDAGTFAHEVAAIQVGADTYLFYNDTNPDVTGADSTHMINSAIKLLAVSAASITTADFV